MTGKLIVLLLTFVVAWVGTEAVRRYALARSVLDVPNARSSHSVPTPRGGGVAIVLSFIAALVLWEIVWGVSGRLFWALMPSSSLVALIGFMDDHSPLPARLRLAFHFVAAGWAVYWIGGMPSLDLGFALLQLGWTGSLLAVIGLVWSVNLYNFMDGIDGIAGGQAVFVSVAGAALLFVQGGDAWPLLVLGAASAGFLLLNWPPARIFMGDAGSGFLGFAIGTIALHATTQGLTSVWPWVILMGVFIVDSTVTLLRRAMQGMAITSPHRTHAYQWASRRYGQHRIVTIGVLTIGAIALMPGAFISIFLPEWAVLISLVVLFFLAILVIRFHAGLPEGK